MSRAGEIAARRADVLARIADAERKAGRPAGSVALVAVGKTYPIEDLVAAHAAGARAFGENRVKEAEAKFPLLPPGCARHLIGPIQSNKANRAAKLADVVETVDSKDLARRLDRAAAAEGKTLEVFVQVRLGGEATKSGVEPKDAPALVEAVRKLPALRLLGFMTIPPPGDTRPHFASLRQLAEPLGLAGLSMGMSDDFEGAIAEGATHVRVGSAIFGERRREIS
ncbi:MAG TPA: YggS family pyridoxal phosphate-dependent enzyme [Thermoanaerobaculia bacterium]|nr:YggS family pyridoxal phosphate-dependent enzyme [Thermoanaerobaculia bacterium]